MTNPIEKRPGCVALAASIVGDKWTPLIIYGLAQGIDRFGGLQKSTGGINPRTLSARLEELQRLGIITRTNHGGVPPCVVYGLTPKGSDLIPILQSMAAWGDKYHADATTGQRPSS